MGKVFESSAAAADGNAPKESPARPHFSLQCLRVYEPPLLAATRAAKMRDLQQDAMTPPRGPPRIAS